MSDTLSPKQMDEAFEMAEADTRAVVERNRILELNLKQAQDTIKKAEQSLLKD